MDILTYLWDHGTMMESLPSFTTLTIFPHPDQEYMAAVYLAGDITLLTFNELYALRVPAIRRNPKKSYGD